MARGPIIFGNGATDFDHWLSAELQRYLESLSGTKLSVISKREIFELNSEVLTATEEFAKFIKNVVNFHHSLPYWEKVRWHRWATRYTNEIIKLDPGRGLA